MKYFIDIVEGQPAYGYLIKTFYCKPLGYHRMTRYSKFNAVAKRYYDYKNTLALQKQGFSLPLSGTNIYFLIPMPPSWTNKKKRLMKYEPHKQKPDVDNLLKAFLDSMMVEDKEVWDIRATKFWSQVGGIIVTTKSFHS